MSSASRGQSSLDAKRDIAAPRRLPETISNSHMSGTSQRKWSTHGFASLMEWSSTRFPSRPFQGAKDTAQES
jgi:hypothetical protein